MAVTPAGVLEINVAPAGSSAPCVIKVQPLTFSNVLAEPLLRRRGEQSSPRPTAPLPSTPLLPSQCARRGLSSQHRSLRAFLVLLLLFILSFQIDSHAAYWRVCSVEPTPRHEPTPRRWLTAHCNIPRKVRSEEEEEWRSRTDQR